MDNQPDPYAWKPRTPLSDRLVVDEGTKKARTAIQRPRREGIQGGLSSLDINYQKPVKRKRKGQPDNLTEGVEPDSLNDVEWEESITDPDVQAIDGIDRHMQQMLYNEYLETGENESNFF